MNLNTLWNLVYSYKEESLSDSQETQVQYWTLREAELSVFAAAGDAATVAVIEFYCWEKNTLKKIYWMMCVIADEPLDPQVSLLS